MGKKQSKLFKKDLKRMSRRNVDFSLLDNVIEQLSAHLELEKKYMNHRLEGKYSLYMSCHITPDWILIYRLDDKFLYLERTGTHSDLY